MTLLITCLLLLLLISLVSLLVRSWVRILSHPPIPPRLPIIGNLHQLGPLPHRAFGHLSKKYGPVMFLKLGTVPTIVISSADAARRVLKDHDLDCCSRPRLAASGRITYNYVDMGFSPYGHHWREMRKLCVIELFSVKRGQEFRHVREEEVSSLVNSIRESSGAVDLKAKSIELTTSVVFKTAFGKAYDGSELSGHRIHEAVEEAEEVLGCFFASDYFPYVGWIVDRITGLHARLEKSFRQLDDFYEYLIDQHLDPERKKVQNKEDIVDVLLKIEAEQREFDASQFTKDHVKAILTDIFLAGVTTSAVAITWAMAELSRKPSIMRKAQTEIRVRVGKKGKVDEEDIDGLQYLKMIVKETLRLHPPASLLLPREVRSHFKLNGYDVHPKTRLEVNAWAIGRDPSYWTDPEEFHPERFSDGHIDFRGKHFELLPFGGGRRICPGMYMGIVIVELALANLLYCFDWELPNGMKEEDVDMEEGPGLATPKKRPLELVPIRYQCP